MDINWLIKLNNYLLVARLISVQQICNGFNLPKIDFL